MENEHIVWLVDQTHKDLEGPHDFVDIVVSGKGEVELVVSVIKGDADVLEAANGAVVEVLQALQAPAELR